jgi:glyoxylase-like metal-dependent hydrolase (beta-lactamase superfamily II)
MTAISIVPVPLGEFRFAADEPYAGEVGVVVGYAVRHAAGTLLFDTGFGFGNDELDAHYRVQARDVTQALEAAGVRPADVDAVVNCHLHADHAGQNGRFPGVPIYVQAAEWEIAHTTDHTILEWIDTPGTDYRIIAGDHELAPGIQIIATPGHTPGHQSLAVQTSEGLVVLTGQAVYSPGEWVSEPGARQGRSRAPDQAAYDRSIARLRALEPVEVRFAHDPVVWRP